MLFAILRKEITLTLRDIHALMVLFAMPVAFILIMSLALQDVGNVEEKQFDVALVFMNSDDKSHPAMKMLTSSSIFQYKVYKNEAKVIAHEYDKKLLAAVVIPKNFFLRIQSDSSTDVSPIKIKYSATTPLPLRKLLAATLQRGVANYLLDQRLAEEMKNPVMRKGLRDKFMGDALFLESELSSGETSKLRPSSVQQSVPAWLIFSMFFVVIPIATTFVTEKQAGTLQRLLTLPASHTYLLLGKLIPYLFINLIQTLLMFLVGIYLVPLVGGDGLVLTDNAWLLLPMSFSVGVLAICLALFIATVVRSTEQATTLGGVINLLLAAIGGIMVPLYVMPEFMQQLALYSPMNWGLDGFLTILLRAGEFDDILLNISRLLILAAIFFILAVMNYQRGIKTRS